MKRYKPGTWVRLKKRPDIIGNVKEYGPAGVQVSWGENAKKMGRWSSWLFPDEIEKVPDNIDKAIEDL